MLEWLQNPEPQLFQEVKVRAYLRLSMLLLPEEILSEET